MSLFALYQNQRGKAEALTRAQATEALSGNLCRCTGYRPILEAALQMQSLPPVHLEATELLQKLELVKHVSIGLEPDYSYILPTTLAALLSARAQHPQAQIVAGCTDVGLWVNKLHMNFAQVLDVSRVQELRQIEDHPHEWLIGAAATLTQAFAALVADRPHVHTFAARFAGLPVRNAGTLGGNVANGSPIGDTMPLLIALGSRVVLMSERGQRDMPLEDFYTGYRKNVLLNDEVLAWIKVPKATPGELSRVFKISKRFEDDISAVCLALKLQVVAGQVVRASIGAGGVAATPMRAVQTEAALAGQPWTQATITQAMATLRQEFTPLSDLRASAAYRVQVLGNLLQRFWLESQGVKNINLEDFDLSDLDALEGQNT
jgi:xanthine dehydrogenase small subunit